MVKILNRQLFFQWFSPKTVRLNVNIYFVCNLGKFTSCTDVWSFGVTLWEIFTFARTAPYHELTDTQIIELSCEAIQHPEREYRYLYQPEHCPSDIYKLMKKCWQMEADNRPTFAYINRYFSGICSSSEGEI